MIGKLKGRIAEVHGTQALFETSSGVFYWVYISPRLIDESSDLELYTYHDIKEDHQQLFGFASYDEYRVFTFLVSVDGVGPKTAFTILCTSSPHEIQQSVITSDVDFFQRIKGIGKKTAQRILVDLSGRLGAEFDLATSDKRVDEEAVDALVSLGFKIGEARQLLADIEPDISLEQKIKAALRKLSRT
ncbi:Holliday junction DNA helicase RuvA [Candidatus Roizmanbacteria bacterium RIFCSPLOWO2_01_FULL_42_14]|uniref:Holliday junction branch migration complex subunit RuvA n=3 Tax=Candidatus Roizmaniibacteriota TaxID=1752723 RepID=A0A1F7JVQ5_9BACT|nr:MAG: Holliday junction DNA helicase RuvA [Candidatus Roizmanbacteria bacterium RIFCSPHIGHO2_12_FULL_42_10]OGK51578.1 MAG: Holliday junction DNA helicase RuvA [Candidatus Roizmanbacteria bacterium RIFCSPLOWO2_01_FULL_42_14]OGK59700.1 MAG: Holliday junction DNA helicase RuvA [Candidatus Roizmanbacteria bacterium RIFCSPLOWO2_02_FULL_43_10]